MTLLARPVPQVGHEQPVAGIEGFAVEEVGSASVPPAGGQLVCQPRQVRPEGVVSGLG
ncbi:hypothetical protein [Streptomyces sp. NRRL B-24085]|uniref:hypothetical protein n=1 Tax=Streptomyces sp. NRRL B-24085 TaxID=1709476 RepID=UPI00131C2EF2|nr:hypothetical protein [Streptomyces sp. NRRL B-24085]